MSSYLRDTTLGFDAISAQVGGSTSTKSGSVTILVVFDAGGGQASEGGFNVLENLHEIGTLLQKQMSNNVFYGLQSGQGVNVTMTLQASTGVKPGWTDKSKTKYVNLVHWGRAAAGGMAQSNNEGQTRIDMSAVDIYFSDSEYKVNSQFMVNLLAHEIFWLNIGAHKDRDSIPGGEISSGNPTYRHSQFDVRPDSRDTILKDFGW